MKGAAAAGTVQCVAEYAKPPGLPVTFLRRDIWGLRAGFVAGFGFQCCQISAEGPWCWVWLALAKSPGRAELRERFGMWSRASYRVPDRRELTKSSLCWKKPSF